MMPLAGGFEQVGVKAVVDGFKPYMAKLGQMEAKTKGFGSKVGSFLKMGALVGGAALVGLGAAALKLGGEFDKAYDKIRVGTGATGEALEGLKKDFKAVFAAIPTDMESASNAVTQFNTLSGATGETLQTLSKQALEAARMMGEDSAALIDQFGGAMNAWQIPARSAPAVLDAIFDVSQRTNVPMTKLVGTLSSYGPVLKNLGLSVTDSIAIFGSFEKAGIEVSRVMPGINAFMRNLAAEGVEDLRGGFEGVIEQIKAAKSDTEALNIATEAFGAEGAQRLSVAVRTGVFDIQDLRDGMRDSYGAIMETSEATMSWTEKLKILKNKGIVAMEPALIGLFDGLTKLFTLIEKRVIPAMQKWWKKHGPAIVKNVKLVAKHVLEFEKGLLKVYLGIAKFLAPSLDTLSDLWANLKPILEQYVLPPLKAVGKFLTEHQTLLVAVAGAILLLMNPWLAVVAAIAVVLAKWDEISAFFKGLGKDIKAFVDGVIQKVSDFPIIGEIIKDAFRTAKIAVDTYIKIIKALVKAGFDSIINIFKFWKAIFTGDWDAAWDALKDQAKVIWTLLSSLFGIALDAIKAVFSSKLTMIQGIGSDLGNLIVDAAGAIWRTLKDVFSNSIRSLELWVSQNWARIKGIGESVVKAIGEGLRSAIGWARGALNALITIIERGVNTIIDLINAIPDVSLPFGLGNIGIPNIGHVSVPRLQPQAEVVREAVLAPSVAPQAAAAVGGGVEPAALAAAVASALQGVTVVMDGREVGNIISDRLGDRTSLLGRGG